jgi:hypothetical protein
LNTKREQIQLTVSTWIKNRHIKFYKSILLGFVPSEINPTAVGVLLATKRYGMSEAEYKILSILVHSKKASYKQKTLYFALEDAKQTAVVLNKKFLLNAENIYNHHASLGTPFNGIIFHIFCYLQFGIGYNATNNEFTQLLSFMLTDDQQIKDRLSDDDYFIPARKKSSKFNSNKSKDKWLARATEHNHKLEIKKRILFPKKN